MITKLPALFASALAALFLALLWPSPAAAKEALAVQVCGGPDCVLTTDRAALRRFMSSLNASPQPVAAPRPAAYLRVDLAIGAEDQPIEDSWTFYYVRRERLMATNGEPGEVLWYPVSWQAHATILALSEGIVSFDAPPHWPERIKRSPNFKPNAGGRTTSTRPEEAGDNAAQTRPASVESAGDLWSNWLIVPLAAVGMAGAAAARRHRR